MKIYEVSLAQAHADEQARHEEAGGKMYWQGRPRCVCINPAQQRGWDEAQRADGVGADLYWRAMMADADDTNMDIPTHVENGEWMV